MTDPDDTIRAMSSQTPAGPPPRPASNTVEILGDYVEQFNLHRIWRNDLSDIYRFYVEPANRDRLDSMGWLKRWLLLPFWLLKGMFFKLTMPRRVMLVVSFVLAASRGSGSGGLSLGFLVLLSVLMLELKDKLLAHDELAAGHAVQSALMPERSPRVPGWDIWLLTRPASDVGGDLVDHIAISPERHGLALADVSGKGLGAALVMAKLQATVRAIAPSTPAFDELGTTLNGIFDRDAMPDRFASLLYLEAEPASGVVRVLNAGHLPPLVVRRDAVEELPRGGPALGVLAEAAYVEQAVELKSGEALVVYSDGLTEAFDGNGEMFGDGRLQAVLDCSRGAGAAELGNRLLRALAEFIGDTRPGDDISLIVLRRAEAARR